LRDTSTVRTSLSDLRADGTDKRGELGSDHKTSGKRQCTGYRFSDSVQPHRMTTLRAIETGNENKIATPVEDRRFRMGKADY